MAFGVFPAATTGSAFSVTSSADGEHPRVGIGGIIPLGTLHVYTTGSGETPVIVTVSGSSGESDIVKVDKTGSVGIGCTPAYRLDIAPDIASAFRIRGTTAGQDVNCAIENTGDQSTDDVLMSYTTQGGAGDPSIRFAIAGNETYSMGIDNSDGDKFKISAASTLHTDTRLTLHGPKLGVNQDSPTHSLDVTGDARLTSNLTVSGTLNVSGNVTINDNAFVVDTSANAVGIGTTTPNRTLDVEAGGDLPQIRVTYSDNTHYTDLFTSNNGTFRVTPTSRTMQVDTGDANGGNVEFTKNGGVKSGGIAWNTSNLDVTLFSEADLHLGAGGLTESMFTIDNSGKVGIGVTDPDTTLEVFSTSTQLKLSYDASNYSTLGVDSGGDLTITPSSNSGKLTVAGNIIPSADNSKNLGSATERWANIYTGDLHLKNDRGDWTIVEEEDYLSVINNKTGKKYKMVLQEVEE